MKLEKSRRKKTPGGHRTLYDIETGSLVTPPSSYRVIFLKNKELDVSARVITSIDANLPDNLNFADYSQQAMRTNLDRYFIGALTAYPFSLSDSLALSTAPIARNAWMAHLAGDENIASVEQTKIDALNYVTPVPTYTIFAATTLWTDIGIKDSKWHIKLTSP